MGEERAQLLEQAAAADEELALLSEPYAPRLLAADATPEALAGLVATHGRLLIADDEGGLFGTLCGRYADGRAFLDSILKPYSAGGFRIDRVSKPPIIAPRALLAVLLSVQPHVLEEVTRHVEIVERGLLARFAVFYATRPNRDVRRTGHAIPEGVESAWRLCVRGLYELPRDGPVEVTATPEALDIFDDYAERFELQQRDEALSPAVASWLAKHVGRTARIATILHLGDGAKPTEPIPSETIKRAVDIAEVAAAHSRHAIDATSMASNGQRILTAVAAGKLGTEATVREIQRAVRSFRDAAAVKAALEQLAEHGLARARDERIWEFHPRSHPPPDSGGQPPQPVTFVTPVPSRG